MRSGACGGLTGAARARAGPGRLRGQGLQGVRQAGHAPAGPLPAQPAQGARELRPRGPARAAVRAHGAAPHPPRRPPPPPPPPPPPAPLPARPACELCSGCDRRAGERACCAMPCLAAPRYGLERRRRGGTRQPRRGQRSRRGAQQRCGLFSSAHAGAGGVRVKKDGLRAAARVPAARCCASCDAAPCAPTARAPTALRQGIPHVSEFNEEQIDAVAGGPTLRQVALDFVPPTREHRRASHRLAAALLQARSPGALRGLCAAALARGAEAWCERVCSATGRPGGPRALPRAAGAAARPARTG